ncbi:MAG: PqqD family protein [Gallionella sp.]|nr:PqqD family protein [Gallionella sp.]MDD4958645.1 PqqD family protein [Gallionella sp.]
MTTLSSTSTICRCNNHLATAIDGGLVIMSIEQGNYCDLDAIASDVWQRLDQPITVTDLCVKLGQEYDANLDTIQRDILILLKKLASEKLITIQS